MWGGGWWMLLGPLMFIVFIAAAAAAVVVVVQNAPGHPQGALRPRRDRQGRIRGTAASARRIEIMDSPVADCASQPPMPPQWQCCLTFRFNSQ
jgi:hypothetical protein